MQYLMLLFCFFYSLEGLAQKLTAKEKEDLLLNTIYYELYKRMEKIQVKETKAPETSVNKGERGKQIIEKARQKNLALIAKKNGIDPSKVKGGADIIRIQQAENKKFIQYMNQVRKDLEKMKQRSLRPSEWNEKFNEIYSKWQADKAAYAKDIKLYQDNTFDLPLVLPVSEKDSKAKVKVDIKKEHQFVAKALELDIQNQLDRPTCSAFTGIRAIEIALAQKGKPSDLSEQYFYWASKPNCRQKPCGNKGSWVGDGLEFSKFSKTKDIPLESDCPYNPKSMNNNETQIPLEMGCKKGAVKVGDYAYLKTLDMVAKTLSQNKPVIASFKLTPNFYQNEGLVLDTESLIGPSLDQHAYGHSLMLIGLVKLPESLDEGSYCFITSNSWGQGWGMGGYSCLSEKWMLKNRQVNPFVVINSVQI
jgi:C1A family cysteine protease